MGARLRRPHLRDAARAPSARPLLPERHRGTGEPHQRSAGALDLGPPATGDPGAVARRRARDVHVGMRVSGRTMSAASSASTDARGDVAVLASGGLDSAILVAELLCQGRAVHPIYVRSGLAWEPTEEVHLRRFLDTLTSPAPQPLTALHGVHAIALGTLKGNPFPDSSREFFDDFAALVHRGLGHSLEVVTPFAGLTKADVLALGRGLALQHPLSCIDPRAGRHCGRCNKCAERRLAFAALQIDDVTEYE